MLPCRVAAADTEALLLSSREKGRALRACVTGTEATAAVTESYLSKGVVFERADKRVAHSILRGKSPIVHIL